jgi:hypothetical protein
MDDESGYTSRHADESNELPIFTAGRTAKMTNKPFLKPRITGARFAGGAIPLEVLADFAVLSEMILEVAKWKYREDNPSRHRAPRGFSDGISLKLTGVEEGSAIPVISLVVGSALLLPTESEQYFHIARDSVISAVVAAEQGTRITDHLPEKLLGYFDRFGRNLAEGEAIELVSDSTHQRARLTKDTRRKLVLASSAKHYTEETSVYGLVHEFDQRAKTFQLTLPGGEILKGIPADSQHYDCILEAHKEFRNQQRVRVTGVGRFDVFDKLLEIDIVEHVVPLDSLDIVVRIEELKLLKRGWLDGKGEALDPQKLDWVVEAFKNYYANDAKLPYLFATPEGQLLAEWSLGENSISLEIDLGTRNADWHVLNLTSDDEELRQLDLNKSESWEWLSNAVKDMGGISE